MMRGIFSSLSGVAVFAAAGTLAFVLQSGAALAGGHTSYKGGPADSGRTIWEGFHLGAHLGWTDNDFGVGQTNPASPLATVNDDSDGAIGGIVYGSSWQFGQWVLGTDSDFSFSDSDTGLSFAANGLSASAEIDWSSSTRVRAGYLFNPNTLVYGTVGIASAEVEVTGTLIAGGSDDERAFGVQYGAGIESTFGGRYFARVEYLHTDYGTEKFAAVGGGTFDVDLDSDTVRGAIGYRFDWSPLDLLRN